MIDNVDNIVKDGGCMEEMEDGCVRERGGDGGYIGEGEEEMEEIYCGGRGGYIYIYIRYVRMDVGDDGMCM